MTPQDLSRLGRWAVRWRVVRPILIVVGIPGYLVMGICSGIKEAAEEWLWEWKRFASYDEGPGDSD